MDIYIHTYILSMYKGIENIRYYIVKHQKHEGHIFADIALFISHTHIQVFLYGIPSNEVKETFIK